MSYPQVSCVMCSKPIDLTIDLNTDETGKAVHQRCYFDRITGKSGTASPSRAWQCRTIILN